MGCKQCFSKYGTSFRPAPVFKWSKLINPTAVGTTKLLPENPRGFSTALVASEGPWLEVADRINVTFADRWSLSERAAALATEASSTRTLRKSQSVANIVRKFGGLLKPVYAQPTGPAPEPDGPQG